MSSPQNDQQEQRNKISIYIIDALGLLISFGTCIYLMAKDLQSLKFLVEIFNFLIILCILFCVKYERYRFWCYFLFIINQSSAYYYEHGICLYSNLMRFIWTCFYIRYHTQFAQPTCSKHLITILDVKIIQITFSIFFRHYPIQHFKFGCIVQYIFMQSICKLLILEQFIIFCLVFTFLFLIEKLVGNTAFLAGAIYDSRNYQDIILLLYTYCIVYLFYKNYDNKQSENDEMNADEDTEEMNLGILNDFIHSMSKSSGKLILKMKYQRSEDTNDMQQQVQSYNAMAKRMLKADDEKKMIVRFKNSEFQMIDEEQIGNEDVVDLNQNQRKPLEFWIRRAAAQLIVKREEEENKQKEKLCQNGLLNMNPVSSIINDEFIFSEKGHIEQGIIGNKHKNGYENKKNELPSIKKNNEKPMNIEGSGLMLMGNGGGISSNNHLFGAQINSAQQNSTLPYSSNIPQLGSNKSNELSNMQNQQNGSNIFNSNIHNNNPNMSEDNFILPLNSPKSTHDLNNLLSDRKFDKIEDQLFTPQYPTLTSHNIFVHEVKGDNQNGSVNVKEGGYTPNKILQAEAKKQMSSFKKVLEKQRNVTSGELQNSREERISSNKKKKEKQEDIKNTDDGVVLHNNNNEKGETSKSLKNGKTKQKTSKSNLTNQDDKQQIDEPLFNNQSRRDFTIEHFKGVLFIKRKNEVYRKVTIGSFMEGDEVFVLLSIEKDYLVLEKKISQLRELLNLYESLYLYCLKCLKSMTYDAYLDIPKMEEEEKVKNNLEGLWNKNNSLHLQLKVIINKIMNMKDVINLQKPVRTPLFVEHIDISKLFIELISDFRPILEEKNITIQIQNYKKISIINSHKRVKQVLFNIFQNAIKNTKKDYSVQVLIDYYMDNTKIVQFHIINMIENMQTIPKDDSCTKLDIKEILKSAQKSSSKKKKKDRRKNNNIIQVGLRVSNKILTLIGPKNGLIMKKVDGTFQTQFHVFSDASVDVKNERIIKKDNKEKQEEIYNLLICYFL